MQLAQIGDEGVDLGGRGICLTRCEQAAVEQLVDGDDGGVAFRKVFAQPLLRFLRLARHRVIVLQIVGQGIDFRARNVGGIEHELAARRPAVERYEHEAPRLFTHDAERCAAVRGAQTGVVGKNRAEHEDEQAKQSLFQGSSPSKVSASAPGKGSGSEDSLEISLYSNIIA